LVDREADEVDDEVAKLMGLDVRGGGGGGGGREDAGGDPR
jgi:hypothetical protein